MHRFPEKFDVIYDIPAEIFDIHMLKILIQPLVENSIKHGFKDVKKKGIIHISAYVEGDFLIFVVSDNGAGLTRDLLDLAYENDGYGIKNVNERIKLYYGEECGIQYKESLGGGTTALVKIKRFISKDGR